MLKWVCSATDNNTKTEIKNLELQITHTDVSITKNTKFDRYIILRLIIMTVYYIYLVLRLRQSKYLVLTQNIDQNSWFTILTDVCAHHYSIEYEFQWVCVTTFSCSCKDVWGLLLLNIKTQQSMRFVWTTFRQTFKKSIWHEENIKEVNGRKVTKILTLNKLL